MKSLPKFGLLVAVAMLSVLVVAAPAHATLTPAGAAVSGTSSNSTLTRSGLTVVCPRSTFTGTIAADGRSASGTIDFVRSGAVTCTENLFGSSCTVVVRGRLTLTSASSVAGTSASFNANLDADFDATIRCVGLTISIVGPQALGTCVTATQARQTLNARCNVRATDGSTASFGGSYAITPRITVS